MFNEAYPFGTPGSADAVEGVGFLARALLAVHEKRVLGVSFIAFWRFVRQWLQRNNQDDRSGRSYGDTPLERFIRYGDSDEDLSIGEETGEWVAVYNTLWFPNPRDAQALGFHYGELFAIGENINGGAVIYVSDHGVRSLDLFRTPAERDRAWAAAQDNDDRDGVATGDD